MGLLVDGKWVDRWYDTKRHDGAFVRKASQMRNWVTANGEAGPSGEGGFEAAAGRYHLYISLACPWAHRTLIFRQLKGLDDVISLSIVEPLMLECGWIFDDDNMQRRDDLFGSRYLYEIYLKANPGYTGRVTVPVLWDKQRNTIVNNESSEIIRMMNSAFNHITGNSDDYYPVELRDKIDALNEVIYATVNNGVYRAGFATTQVAYERAYGQLFETLDVLDTRLASQRFLMGNRLTEADWRLFTTLVRFDAVYFGHFKCNQQRIADYPNLDAYVRDLYQHGHVGNTVDIPYIKKHYYSSQITINPTGIVPVGQELDFNRPHGRESLSTSAGQ